MSSRVTTVILLVILAILVCAGVIYMMMPTSSSSPYSAAVIKGSDNSSTEIATTSKKFSDQPYYKFAYRIDPTNLNNMNSSMQKIFSGFRVTTINNADGSFVVNLTPTNTEYHAQSYTVKQGQKLYFIEKSMGDDNGVKDSYYADDTAVVVDQNGDVIQ